MAGEIVVDMACCVQLFTFLSQENIKNGEISREFKILVNILGRKKALKNGQNYGKIVYRFCTVWSLN